MTSRSQAEALDAADPLAGFRDRFALDDGDRLYVDGNSLGRLPLAARERVAALVDEWGEAIVTAWPRWIELPEHVGDLLGRSCLGAAPGTVLVADSTTVNLYKLAAAALAARGGGVLVTDEAEFPTDRYVLQGLGDMRLLRSDPIAGPTADDVAAACAPGDVALVCLSLVSYRSARARPISPRSSPGERRPRLPRPDSVRLGLPPLYTRFVDVWDAVDRIERLVAAASTGSSRSPGRASPDGDSVCGGRHEPYPRCEHRDRRATCPCPSQRSPRFDEPQPTAGPARFGAPRRRPSSARVVPAPG